jgi:dynein heavy chain 1, cytosolic
VHLTPDVASHVTIANFTVTPASLESQSLSKVFQRAAVLKLQGEQNVKLRELEDQMLAKISAFEGCILEDNQVVADCGSHHSVQGNP